MTDRFSRQADIVPRERILDCTATIIGVGAIGRQVALQLTAIGVPHLQLIDFDSVETSNLATQGFMQKDLKRPKIDVTAEFVREMNHNLNVEVILERFKRSTPVGNCVFACVDSIEIRKLIWDTVKDKVNFFCDGRMSAEVLRIITACDEKGREYYPQTLFAAEQAHARPKQRSTAPILQPVSCSLNSQNIFGCCRLILISRSICWLRRSMWASVNVNLKLSDSNV